MWSGRFREPLDAEYWPLFRYNPALADLGRNPFQLDSRPASLPLEKYIYNEGRYTMLVQSAPETAAELLADAQKDVATRWKLYEHWASMQSPSMPVASTSPADQGVQS